MRCNQWSQQSLIEGKRDLDNARAQESPLQIYDLQFPEIHDLLIHSLHRYKASVDDNDLLQACEQC